MSYQFNDKVFNYIPFNGVLDPNPDKKSFKSGQPGCCCKDCGEILATFGTNVCGRFGGPVAGVLITVTKGGVTIGTCLTNSSGVCSIVIPFNGVYDWTASKSTYTTVSGRFTVADCKNIGISVQFPVPPGYQCIPLPCCRTSKIGPPYEPLVAPLTLFLHDGFGLISLTRYTLGGGWIWGGCAIRNAFAAPCPPNHPPDPCGGLANVTVGVTWDVQCAGSIGGEEYWIALLSTHCACDCGGFDAISGRAPSFPTASTCANQICSNSSVFMPNPICFPNFFATGFQGYVFGNPENAIYPGGVTVVVTQ